MDGSTIEHSDSESGDSWTLLDNSSNYADDAQDVADLPTSSSAPEIIEKDEDTDGISIITDSEPDTPSSFQIDNDHYLSEENIRAEHFSQYIPLNSDHSIQHCDEQEKEDILGDNTGKHKTYVHRRNKRLSAVLNIIMLGSVITAAGVAIGHMWGARTDCSTHSTTNVNQILSNLYKLQEENAYLRCKLKELSANNNGMNRINTAFKENNCNKVYNEATKCDDNMNDSDPLKSHMTKATEPNENSKLDKNKRLEELFKMLRQRYISKNINNPEKLKYFNDILEIKNKNNKDEMNSPELMNETNNLKYQLKMFIDIVKYVELYAQHGKPIDLDSWNEFHYPLEPELDKLSSTSNIESEFKVVKNIEYERRRNFGCKNDQTRFKGHPPPYVSPFKFVKTNVPRKRLTNPTYEKKIYGCIKKLDMNKLKGDIGPEDGPKDLTPYADMFMRLRGECGTLEELLNSKGIKDTNEQTVSKKKTYTPKNENVTEELKTKNSKKNKNLKDKDSDEEIKKDNRYNGQKKKQERKKYDRQQTHKKIKRRNKYEQWEMKGGLLKDFDDVSWTSSQEENFDEPNTIDRQISHNDNVNKDNYKSEKKEKNDESENTKGNNVNWSDDRAVLRKLARKRLEKELFGNSGNTAGWYFRRMRKREQSRGKEDNSTYRKLLKRNMNYKFKK